MNSQEIKEAGEQLARLRETCRQLQTQLGSVRIGQGEVVRLLLTGLMSGGHMLVIGVPGLAKTMMVKALADLLGWDFRRIQFTPDLMPADITCTEILQSDETGRKRDLIFHKGPVFANLILADEINRTGRRRIKISPTCRCRGPIQCMGLKALFLITGPNEKVRLHPMPGDADQLLTDYDRMRYSRQMLIWGWGEAGQARLKASRVFIAGAGGLGSPVAMYLAAAGVGEIRLCDVDRVELSNLNRQILHGDERIGQPKTVSAEKTLKTLNPTVKVLAFSEYLDAESIDRVAGRPDILLDCLDNYETRYLLNRYALEQHIPLVHDSIRYSRRRRRLSFGVRSVPDRYALAGLARAPRLPGRGLYWRHNVDTLDCFCSHARSNWLGWWRIHHTQFFQPLRARDDRSPPSSPSRLA